MPQEQDSAAPWSHNLHQVPRVADIGEEDFSKFLDLDNSFEQFQDIGTNDGHSTLETPMGRLAFGSSQLQDIRQHEEELIQNLDMAQFQHDQMYQQMGPSHGYQIPPTPVSAEMHASKYGVHVDQSGHIFYDRHQASFTPLVSPAQTPLDNAFCMPELSDYMVSDDFFSPLTSPAIEAQPSFASASSTASPIDLSAENTSNHQAIPVMKPRGRKANFPQQRTPRSVKQSPAMKPQQKKRQFSLSSIPRDRLETMLEGQGLTQRMQAAAGLANAFASSEDSVSPEPLTESIMGPPPIPSTIGKSPLSSHPATAEQNLPATPATIMRLPNTQPATAGQSGQFSNEINSMEDMTLPDAAAALPELVDQNLSADNQTTPTLAAKPIKSTVDSTPRIAVMKKQNLPADVVDKSRKIETKIGGRGGKKRQSISSSTISPALRPKMSPSISPLVPAPGPGMTVLTPETSALFLASKSNYQNILDGTHLPGVSYPQTLADNLSSKRTSHKLAEQGRRNRINLALREIESLLPPSILAGVKKEKSGSGSRDGEDESPDKSGAAGQGTSKASTVEMAIVYIKQLQAELKETKDQLEEARNNTNSDLEAGK